MGMEVKMERLEYALNPLEHSTHENGEVIMALCENSQGSSEDVIPPNTDSEYEVRDTGVFQYRFLNQQTPANNSLNGNVSTPIAGTTPAALQPTNCQFYVISDLSPSRPCLISPKPDTSTGCTRHLIVNASKKRDEKRRATHNEVERRRRDKINQWIFKLKDLLPDSNNDQKNKSAMGDSKGEILIKACDYIKSMQEQIESLKECLSRNDVLVMENNLLKEQNCKLQKENENFLKLVGKKHVKVEHDVKLEAS